MQSSDTLHAARRNAGLTQRELAALTGIAQPTIARIESGRADPRVSTLAVLLNACGQRLAVEVASARGAAVDHTQIHALLRLSPRERVDLLRRDAAGWQRFEAAAKL